MKHRGVHDRMMTCAEMVEVCVRDVLFLDRYHGRSRERIAARRMCAAWHRDGYHR